MKEKIIKIENFIINLDKKKLISFFYLIVIIKIGIWYHPALWKLLEISINPFNEKLLNDPYSHYLFYNFLGGYLAGILNISTKLTFFIFHLFFSLSFNLVFFYLAFTKLSRKLAVYSITLFLVFPVSTIVFFWVGYDSITLTILILSVLFKSYSILVIIFGFLAGLQHFEISFVSSMSLFFLNCYNHLKNEKSFLDLRYAICLLLGTILGKIILEYHFLNIGLNLNTGRGWYTFNIINHFLYNSFFNFYTIIWFSYSVGWIVILKYFLIKSKNYFFILILFGNLFIILLVDDQTRVYSCITFLILLSQVFLNEKFLKEIKNYEIALIFILWLAIPYSFIWQGVLRTSMFAYDLAYLLNYFFDLFNDESIKSSIIWPFKTLR